MFRKIVTELIYSPALAGSLGEYIKKLRNERAKRQIGVIFVLLALTVQLFAVLFPPESANASNPEVFIDGGIQSIDGYLRYYDQNTRNIRELLTSLEISRADVESAHLLALPSSTAASMWFTQNNRDKDAFAYPFQTSSGKQEIAYYRPLDKSYESAQAYVGSSAKTGEWFAVVKSSGNLITEAKERSDCSAWFSSSINSETGGSSCPKNLETSLSARTILKDSPTTPNTASPLDRIAYTLSITNTAATATPVAPTINLEDVLEYSRILDTGGGTYNYDTKMFSWPSFILGEKERAERSLIVQLLPTTPSTAQGQYITTSYDCLLRATFGNTLYTSVDCPPTKYVEKITSSLPSLSTKANLIFAACLLFTTLYLYLRSRQLLTELYIIRHNHTGGL